MCLELFLPNLFGEVVQFYQNLCIVFLFFFQIYFTFQLIDAGGNAIIENGQMEFEISRWTCSGIKVDNVRLVPPIPTVQKWIRYLTHSDSIYLNF